MHQHTGRVFWSPRVQLFVRGRRIFGALSEDLARGPVVGARKRNAGVGDRAMTHGGRVARERAAIQHTQTTTA